MCPARTHERNMMTEPLRPRSRKVKILATLGPASSKPAMIRKLMLAGADAFRINMSHGDQKSKAKLVDIDPRARKGAAAADDDRLRPSGTEAARGQLRRRLGHARERPAGSSSTRKIHSATRSAFELPHPELFAAIGPGDRLLIDDGKVRLKVLEVGGRQASRPRSRSAEPSRTTRASTSRTWSFRSPR